MIKDLLIIVLISEGPLRIPPRQSSSRSNYKLYDEFKPNKKPNSLTVHRAHGITQIRTLTSRVLAAHRAHGRFAVVARQNPDAFRKATRASHQLLREGVAGGGKSESETNE